MVFAIRSAMGARISLVWLCRMESLALRVKQRKVIGEGQIARLKILDNLLNQPIWSGSL